MRVVSFDPGWQEVGVSEWVEGTPVAWYMLKRMPNYGTYLGKLSELAAWADVFLIEEQHAKVHGIIASGLPTFKKCMMIGSVVSSVLKITKVAAEILVYGVQSDCEIHEIYASSWQSIFSNQSALRALRVRKLPRKQDTKGRSKKIAKAIVKEVVNNHNVADALVMAYKWHLDSGIEQLK